MLLASNGLIQSELILSVLEMFLTYSFLHQPPKYHHSSVLLLGHFLVFLTASPLFSVYLFFLGGNFNIFFSEASFEMSASAITVLFLRLDATLSLWCSSSPSFPSSPPLPPLLVSVISSSLQCPLFLSLHALMVS